MKIVVGFKWTPEGKAALEWAIEEARRRDAEVIVVASSRGNVNVVIGDPPALDSELDRIKAARGELDEAERLLAAAGVPYAIRRYTRGNSAAEDLSDVVAREAADMVVIGLRRRTRTGKLLMGSNALDILLNVGCPVVGVKAKE
ncbi:MAG: universal stress protein [Thermoleophilia bacterium]|nr:universal stress protein [Thermoleophilia bacterium]